MSITAETLVSIGPAAAVFPDRSLMWPKFPTNLQPVGVSQQRASLFASIGARA